MSLRNKNPSERNTHPTSPHLLKDLEHPPPKKNDTVETNAKKLVASWLQG